MSNDSEAEEADVEEQEVDETAADETEADEETAQESETTDEEETTEDGLQEGDFVELDYTARTVEGGDLVDTTDPEIAEAEGVGEDQEFAPRTIVLGQGHLFQAVEDDIYGKEAGDSGSVTVSAEEAFGEYDENEVRTISKDKIPEDDRYPGAHVDVGGEHGHVETIIGGRARVDFNHPLAGEDIEYEYEILREVEDREERAQGLISMFLDMELDVWFETDTVEEEQMVEPDEDEEDEEAEPEFETVEVEKATLYIEATPQLTMNQQWMMGKTQIAQQLTQILDIDRVIVQEELGGGMGGMMGGMGGMMGGGAGGEDIEAALEEADVDADEIMEEIEGAEE
jgi:FKBP-type peptidyl-prolyl cis-trans isomerase SlyD